MGVSRAPLKSKPIEREIYAAPPLFRGKNPCARRGLVKSLYGLATTRRERRGGPKCFLGGLWGKSTFLDKPDFFWKANDFHYGFGKGLRGKRIVGNNEKAIFEENENSERAKRGN